MGKLASRPDNEDNTTMEDEHMDEKDLKILKSELADMFDDKITKSNEQFVAFESKLSGIEEQLGQTCKDGKCFTDRLDTVCTGIECIKTRLDEQDDTVVCPGCKTPFMMTGNMAGNIIICPHCGAQSQKKQSV